ncbi:TPA: hypothetical protein ACPDRM_002210 [Pasteurella multocida]
MRFYLMHKNQIFNSLLHLSGLANDVDKVIELMQAAGHQVSLNQIRDWRRGQNTRNYKPVPSYALEVIFDYLFDMKRSKSDLFEPKKSESI